MSKKNITIPKAIKTAWSEVQTSEDLNWMLCTVEGGLKKKLKLFERGKGGHPHFQHLLKPDSLFFGGFKTSLYESKGATTSVR